LILATFSDSGDQPASEIKGLLLNSLRNGAGNFFLEAGKFGLQTGNFVRVTTIAFDQSTPIKLARNSLRPIMVA
jgi:hypothetical protein